MQPQGHIGILGRIFGRFRHRHAVEGDFILALAGDLAERDRRVGEMQLRQFVHAVAVQAAFQDIGNQHRVIDGIEPDAALEKDQRIIFEILPHFQNRRVLQQRLQPGDHIRLRHLEDGVIAVELKAIAAAMTARDVAGLTRRHRQRDATQARLHGVE